MNTGFDLLVNYNFKHHYLVDCECEQNICIDIPYANVSRTHYICIRCGIKPLNPHKLHAANNHIQKLLYIITFFKFLVISSKILLGSFVWEIWVKFFWVKILFT